MKREINILYIEDNPADAFLIKEFLKEINTLKSNYFHCENLAKGLVFLKENEVDVILLDLNLPDCTNEECIDTVVENFPEPCLIIVTGNDDIDLGEYAIEKGAQDYLEKNLLTPNYLQKSLLFATRRKKQEYYLKKAIEAKNKLFSIIAHDLRSPLGNMVALSSLIESDFENMSKGELKYLLSTQNNTGQALFGLLENLLQWSRINLKAIKPDLQEINLNKLLEELIQTNKANFLLKKVTVNLTIKEQVTIISDIDLLQTVLRNLLSNSIKFTKNGGQVILNLAKELGKVILTIKDNGIGMPDEIQKNLFKPGFKTNRMGTNNEPSSGLGLVLVYEILKLLNGEISFESEVNKGTEFKITLKS